MDEWTCKAWINELYSNGQVLLKFHSPILRSLHFSILDFGQQKVPKGAIS